MSAHIRSRPRADDFLIAWLEAFPHSLVDADRRPGSRLMKAREVIEPSGLMEAQCHVKPGAGPFAGVDGAGFERWRDLAARQGHHYGTEPSKHLGAKPRHPVTQPLETFRRSNLAGEPSAHLSAG